MKTMNIICGGITGCVLGASFAIAGDMGSIHYKPVAAKSSFRPVGSLFGGFASLNANHSEGFLGPDARVFSYNAQGNANNGGFVGAFLGMEHALPSPGLFMQAGLEYDYFDHSSPSGYSIIGVDSTNATLYNYDYSIQSQQAMVVAKLFTTFQSQSGPVFPYVFGGIGAAFNNASDFHTATKNTASMNSPAIFDNNKTSAFSYAVGLGVDTNVSEHLRIGMAYRLSHFGNASLGNGHLSSNQNPTSFALNTPSSYANQLMFQISYLA